MHKKQLLIAALLVTAAGLEDGTIKDYNWGLACQCNVGQLIRELKGMDLIEFQNLFYAANPASSTWAVAAERNPKNPLFVALEEEFGVTAAELGHLERLTDYRVLARDNTLHTLRLISPMQDPVFPERSMEGTRSTVARYMRVWAGFIKEELAMAV